MAVTLSEAAARHVSRYITRRGKGVEIGRASCRERV